MAERTAAKLILSQHQALAEVVVVRQYEQRPELRERYGNAGIAKCIQDTDSNFTYLAAALNYSSRTIFKNYIVWAKTFLTVRNICIEDVDDNLRMMWTVLKEKLPEASAAAVQPYLEDAICCNPQSEAELPTLLGGDDPLSELARKYLHALLQLNRHQASSLVREAFESGVSITDLYLQVFQRCQREIGRLWQLNQLTVAQEHYCTAATQFVLSQLYPVLFSIPKTGRRLVAMSVAGEFHEVGLRIITDLFEANGWDSVYLGANVPTPSLIETLKQLRPDLLAISATMPFHLTVVEELIAQIRSANLASNLKIMVGGGPFNLDPELWRKVADLFASDASQALTIANLLFVPPPTFPDDDLQNPPAEMRVLTSPQYTTNPPNESSPYSELSRLNSDLVTLQRELAKKNADLEREIAERKRLEEQVRQAQLMEAIGRLAGGLAHSLNNLMTTVLGHGKLALGKLKPTDPVFLNLQEMMRSGTRTVALTQKLLAFGRQQLLTLRPINLNATVLGLEPTLKAMLGRIRLKINLDPELATTRSDQDHLERTILRLIANAFNAMPDGGSLTIKTTNVELGEEYTRTRPEISEGSYILLSVSDTGVGIDEETLRSLFEPFARKLGSGTGLGLAAVYGFIKQCGGDVSVQSVVDEGTTFQLYFPKHPEESEKVDNPTHHKEQVV